MVDMMSAQDEREIRTSLRKVLSRFTDEYWMQHDMDHEFPWDFYQAMAQAGWLGICIPEKYGGGGAGVQEAALLLEEVTGRELDGEVKVEFRAGGLKVRIKGSAKALVEPMKLRIREILAGNGDRWSSRMLRLIQRFRKSVREAR